MRLKWHTLALAGSLGFFASWKAVADDASSTPWAPPSTARQAARNSASGGSAAADTESRRLVDELIRQSLVELDAKRFDTARRLAQRAAAIAAACGVVNTRPEQLMVEIDRCERAAAVVVPAAAAPPRPERSHKAEAIQLLDRGIMALDQKRFDEAEQYARQAAELGVKWDRFDYRPENLLEDIRRERPSLASAGEAAPTSNAPLGARPTAPADASPVTEWSNQQTAATAPLPYPKETPIAPSVAPAPVAQAKASEAGRSSAEMLLLQAMDDLRSGRDEMARHRLEQAMASIPGTSQSAPVASFNNNSPNWNRPTLPPNGVLVQGSSPPPAYFPVHRDQPNVNAPFSAQSDVALKPMHDPYLGDEPTTTDKASAGVQAMRESLPTPAPINHVYLSGSAAPSMDDTPVQKVGYNSPPTQAAPSTYIPPKVQTSPDAQALSPQVGWLEKMSTPMPPQGAAPSSNYNAAGAAAGRFNPTPTTVPSSVASDPTLGVAPDQPKPGFFEKVWDAIVGD